MANTTSELISGAVHTAQDNWQNYCADSEQYIRSNPTKSALVAVGVGFLLAQLPLRWMAVALFKLLFLLIKPATFIYAVSRLIDDVRGAGTESAE